MAKTGSIRERVLADGSSAWVLVWRVGGRQVKRTVRGSQRDAERVLTAALAARDRGEMRAVSTETFEVYAERWLEAKKPRLEPSTYRDYETHLRLRLVPTFGRLKLRTVTRDRIERYLAVLDALRVEEGPRKGERVLSRKTINDSLIPLRQILGRAVRDGILAGNSAASSDRDDPLELPYERPEMLSLNREEGSAYLAAAWAITYDREPDEGRAWFGPLAEILLGAGLRIGEALALEWRHVLWDESSLRIEIASKRKDGIGTTKGNRARTVAIDSGLVEVLRRHRVTSGGAAGLVFRSKTGAVLDVDNVRRRGHVVALSGAGLPLGVRMHDLRHSCARWWLASGASIFFVQQQLGHADIQTTIDLYGHADQATHRELAEHAAAWRRSS
jgi:integrase